MEQLLARIAVVVGEGVQAGRIKPAQRELAPLMLLGMLRAVAIRARVEDSDLVALAEPMLDFFLHGAATT
jgi:hypothetical protein